LKQLYRETYDNQKGSKVEGGVAMLSSISRANDDTATTKLLLKLSDEL
jgi:hypothetical protein